MKNRFTFLLFFLFITHGIGQNWIPNGKGFVSASDYPAAEWKMDTTNNNNYFDCNYYNYFSDTAFPVITKEDSMEMKRYSDKFHKIRHQTGSSTYKSWDYNFMPFIQGYVDSVWMEKLARDVNFKYLSLDYSVLTNAITSDGVILGRVINKRKPNDERCLFFKTEYVIEVMDVVHAYFDINIGDKILIYDLDGYAAGCCEDCGIISKSYHIKEYGIGEESLFLLDKNIYRGIFAYKNKHLRDDKYCSQAFKMDMSNYEYHKYVEDKIEDLKLFFNEEFK
ncbi:MAG: hypothetical protein H0V01_13990 [Bacteroidetes bacterium]|nr:hypothetical protein [Bacteroidota bacterium]HET6245368.1 hypothetical protein [Bacteroidia bacterium]